jgi:hypothetical protein
MPGAPLYHMEDPEVPSYMHGTYQESMQANHVTRNVGRTGQVSYVQVPPTSLIHAGPEALGAGLTHLFIVQGIGRLGNLVYRSPGETVMSLLLQSAMEAAL